MFSCNGTSDGSTSKQDISPSLSPSQTGVSTSVEAKPSSWVFKGPGEMLPRKIGKWEISSEPRYFGPENLYDLINGGAEIYVDFGLKEMVTVDYQSRENQDMTITVEIYDQGSPLGAFGRLARFLDSRTDPSNIGDGLPSGIDARGLFGGSDAIFYQDRFLVRLTLLDQSATATLDSMKNTGRNVIPQFATAVSSRLPENKQLMEFGAFPDENRIGRSETWETQKLAGIQGLGAGYAARYLKGDKKWKMFVTVALDDKSAAEALVKEQKETAPDSRTELRTFNNRVIGYTVDSPEWTKLDNKETLEQLVIFEKAL
jgi:Family of unknown function (DUF6599)